MGADETPEIDHDRANVGHLPGGHPDDIPVALRFQHRVKQVHVLFREHFGCRGFRALPREDGDVGDVDGGDRVEGEALAQVVGAVQPAVLYPGPGLQGSEPGFEVAEKIPIKPLQAA